MPSLWANERKLDILHLPQVYYWPHVHAWCDGKIPACIEIVQNEGCTNQNFLRNQHLFLAEFQTFARDST